MLNLERSTTSAADIAALDRVAAEWRRKRYCPGKEVRAIQTLQRRLWRRTRAQSRDYRNGLDLEERRHVWRQLQPWLKHAPRPNGATIGPWSRRLTMLIGQLRAFDPDTAFPQPGRVLTRVQFRSVLIREAHRVTLQFAKDAETQQTTAAAMAADFLRAVCPDICHDATPERVRNLVKYAPRKK